MRKKRTSQLIGFFLRVCLPFFFWYWIEPFLLAI
jgi:hypothetical protein